MSSTTINDQEIISVSVDDKNLHAKQPRFIFFTGGVASSLGKGIASATLGALLQSRGYKVQLRKLDPYLNVDPGTMNPCQHGEVFVTDDGTETDLDLGHYERYTGCNTQKYDSTTTGKIYLELLTKERRGDYLGKTVQVIPHITDIIKNFIVDKNDDKDFVLIEIGGTVGDIEGLPFFEAIRQLRYELGKENSLFVHLTLLPFIKASQELKTKPTQHSVKELRSIGIQPDILLCRAEHDIEQGAKDKIALFCNVDKDKVIPALSVDIIYDTPIYYHQAGFDAAVLSYFNIKNAKPADISKWKQISNITKSIKDIVTIAIVGKYTITSDAYKSVIEALNHGGVENKVSVKIKWINARDLNNESKISEQMSDVDGILVPGGFGNEGIEGKIASIRYARMNNIPFFGICLGMQLALIEIARNLANIPNANSSEFSTVHDNSCNNIQDSNDDHNHTNNDIWDQEISNEKNGTQNHATNKNNHKNNLIAENLIGLMTEWTSKSQIHKRSANSDLGGTMRLGAYDCQITEGTKVHEIYNRTLISERHRHRYEVNIAFREVLENVGVIFSGFSPDGKLPEIIELKQHQWFIGVQFHPEFKSRPLAPHPLFQHFIKVAFESRK